MLFLKPIFRTTLLSIILALLIIYLGIKYHWSDHLKADKTKDISTLTIPPIPTVSSGTVKDTETSNQTSLQTDTFKPEIIPLSDPLNDKGDLISSMTKDQVELHCRSLFNKTIKKEEHLSLAVVDCIVSNYQEPLQNLHHESYLLKKEQIRLSCQKQFINKNYSKIEQQLLIGMCTSDKLTQ